MSQEIEKYKDSQVMALKVDISRLERAMQQNLGSGGLSTSMFPKVVVPSGGSTAWQVPTVSGDKNMDALVGVIIFSQPAKAYYKIPYDEAGVTKTPPDCSSLNGLVGVGDPGGQCFKCPLNQYESALKGKGKACADLRLLFMLGQDSILPMMVKLPPTSVKHVDTYMARLAGTLDAYSDVLTAVTLKKDRNDAGVFYSEAQFAMVRRLTDDERKVVEYFHNLVKTLVVAQQDLDDAVQAEPPAAPPAGNQEAAQ
jgi:hypothetical protein